MRYADKLKDPRWQKKRLEVLSTDEFRCQWCASETKTLHVHHFVYRGDNPWDAKDGDLATICEDCHWLEHRKESLTDLERALINQYIQPGRYFGLCQANEEHQKRIMDVIALIKNYG